MPEYMSADDSAERADEFLPQPVQEFLNDTLHILAAVRPEQQLGGISISATLMQDDDMATQYARVTLYQTLSDVMGALDQRITEWYAEHSDELTGD